MHISSVLSLCVLYGNVYMYLYVYQGPPGMQGDTGMPGVNGSIGEPGVNGTPVCHDYKPN